MTGFRIALAQVPVATTPEDSVRIAGEAIEQAASVGAGLVCFPESYVPGYRCFARKVPAVDAAFLDDAWGRLAQTAGRVGVAVILGTERIVDGGLRITALVLDRDGARLGFQDKVQLDPSEDGVYTPGATRHVFRTGPLTFGVAICHEGFRYPETVRWAVRRGAQVVFHPHVHEADPRGHSPAAYGEPENSFHENAAKCRAAENTCFYATVNCAIERSSTTSAIIDPDGRLLAYQPHGRAGLLVADLDLDLATGLLARRHKPTPEA